MVTVTGAKEVSQVGGGGVGDATAADVGPLDGVGRGITAATCVLVPARAVEVHHFDLGGHFLHRLSRDHGEGSMHHDQVLLKDRPLHVPHPHTHDSSLKTLPDMRRHDMAQSIHNLHVLHTLDQIVGTAHRWAMAHQLPLEGRQ